MFFDKFKFYIMGGLAAVVVLLGIGLTFEHLRLRAAVAEKNSVTTALAVSNASVNDLVSTIGQIKKTLQDTEASEKKLQDEVHSQLQVVEAKDKDLADLSMKLRKGPATDKELNDAWTRLK